jgi:hypothetical protein
MAIEPGIPFTIGEWDFMLGKGYPVMFRGVEVVGVSDWHHSEDEDMGAGATNKVEPEIKYMLEEVFNPWDLEKVTHKPTKTWVEWIDDTTSYTTNHRPFKLEPDMDFGLYNDADGNKVFAERVYDLTDDRLLLRWHDYNVTTSNGYGVISPLDSTHQYKIMYHTEPVLVQMYQAGTTLGANLTLRQNNTYTIPVQTIDPVWSDILGVTHGYQAQYGPITVKLDLNETLPYQKVFEYKVDVEEYDFKVYKEDDNYMMPGWHVTTLDDDEDILPPHTVDIPNGNVTVDVDLDWYNISSSNDLSVTWPLEGETLHVNELTHTVWADVYLEVNATHVNMVLEWQIDVYIDEMLNGRWEHTVVGKDAASVDSIGAALITAAFRTNK